MFTTYNKCIILFIQCVDRPDMGWPSQKPHNSRGIKLCRSTSWTNMVQKRATALSVYTVGNKRKSSALLGGWLPYKKRAGQGGSCRPTGSPSFQIGPAKSKMIYPTTYQPHELNHPPEVDQSKLDPSIILWWDEWINTGIPRRLKMHYYYTGAA